MNYGPVCVNIVWIGLVAGACMMLLRQLHFSDEDLGRVDVRRIDGLWLIYSLAVSVVFLPHISGGTGINRVAFGLLAGYLVLCSVVDTVLQLVFDFFHYIGLLGGCLLLASNNPAPDIIVALILFVGLQWILFRKMYGAADVAAFMVCAVYLAAEGRSMEDYLMHMAATFLLLGVVQLGKGNVSDRGNLKRPVALFPYITVGFFIII